MDAADILLGLTPEERLRRLLRKGATFDPVSPEQIKPAPTGIPASWGKAMPQLDETVEAGAELSPLAKMLQATGAGRRVMDAVQNIPIVNGLFAPAVQMAEIPNVFHGSPYRFNKFDMGKVGTGEGAQAFGHGMYFTSKKEIADHYARSGTYLPSLRRWVDEKGLADNTAIELTRLEANYGTDVAMKFFAKENLKKAERHAWAVKTPESKRAVENAQEVVDALTGKFGPLPAKNKNVYRATLHEGKDPSQYAYMDWYEKIPKSEKLKDGLKSIGFENWQINSMMDRLTGEGLYQSLASHFGMGGRDIVGKQKASAFLKQHGFDGIRYPTETLSGKGAKGGGGFNYVVFDDADITIKGVE